MEQGVRQVLRIAENADPDSMYAGPCLRLEELRKLCEQKLADLKSDAQPEQP